MKKVLLLIVALFFLMQGSFAQETTVVRTYDALNYLKDVKKNEAEYLKQMTASMKANLQVIKETNEKKYLELLTEARFSSSRWPIVLGQSRSENNDLIMELEIQSYALAEKYKNSSSNKEGIKKELNKTLEKLLETKEKYRQEELKSLEEKISELRKSIEVRKKNRNEIIRRRMMDILGESSYYKWD